MLVITIKRIMLCEDAAEVCKNMYALELQSGSRSDAATIFDKQERYWDTCHSNESQYRVAPAIAKILKENRTSNWQECSNK